MSEEIPDFNEFLPEGFSNPPPASSAPQQATMPAPSPFAPRGGSLPPVQALRKLPVTPTMQRLNLPSTPYQPYQGTPTSPQPSPMRFGGPAPIAYGQQSRLPYMQPQQYQQPQQYRIDVPTGYLPQPTASLNQNQNQLAVIPVGGSNVSVQYLQGGHDAINHVKPVFGFGGKTYTIQDLVSQIRVSWEQAHAAQGKDHGKNEALKFWVQFLHGCGTYTQALAKETRFHLSDNLAQYGDEAKENLEWLDQLMVRAEYLKLRQELEWLVDKDQRYQETWREVKKTRDPAVQMLRGLRQPKVGWLRYWCAEICFKEVFVQLFAGGYSSVSKEMLPLDDCWLVVSPLQAAVWMQTAMLLRAYRGDKALQAYELGKLGLGNATESGHPYRVSGQDIKFVLANKQVGAGRKHVQISHTSGKEVKESIQPVWRFRYDNDVPTDSKQGKILGTLSTVLRNSGWTRLAIGLWQNERCGVRFHEEIVGQIQNNGYDKNFVYPKDVMALLPAPAQGAAASSVVEDVVPTIENEDNPFLGPTEHRAISGQPRSGSNQLQSALRHSRHPSKQPYVSDARKTTPLTPPIASLTPTPQTQAAQPAPPARGHERQLRNLPQVNYSMSQRPSKAPAKRAVDLTPKKKRGGDDASLQTSTSQQHQGQRVKITAGSDPDAIDLTRETGSTLESAGINLGGSQSGNSSIMKPDEQQQQPPLTLQEFFRSKTPILPQGMDARTYNAIWDITKARLEATSILWSSPTSNLTGARQVARLALREPRFGNANPRAAEVLHDIWLQADDLVRAFKSGEMPRVLDSTVEASNAVPENVKLGHVAKAEASMCGKWTTWPANAEDMADKDRTRLCYQVAISFTGMLLSARYPPNSKYLASHEQLLLARAYDGKEKAVLEIANPTTLNCILHWQQAMRLDPFGGTGLQGWSLTMCWLAVVSQTVELGGENGDQRRKAVVLSPEDSYGTRQAGPLAPGRWKEAAGVLVNVAWLFEYKRGAGNKSRALAYIKVDNGGWLHFVDPSGNLSGERKAAFVKEFLEWLVLNQPQYENLKLGLSEEDTKSGERVRLESWEEGPWWFWAAHSLVHNRPVVYDRPTYRQISRAVTGLRAYITACAK